MREVFKHLELEFLKLQDPCAMKLLSRSSLPFSVLEPHPRPEDPNPDPGNMGKFRDLINRLRGRNEVGFEVFIQGYFPSLIVISHGRLLLFPPGRNGKVTLSPQRSQPPAIPSL